MSQENNNNTTATTSALALFSLSSPSIPTPSSPTPSSSSSFINEYDTSNCFSRLPHETIFNIISFVMPQKTTTLTIQPYSPHKQLAILSQVCRLFNKIANDALLWQIAFETKFDSEAIIRAGIIDKNVIGGVNRVSGHGGAVGEGEGEGNQTTTQIQTSSSSFEQIQTGGNIWKELYKERQTAMNKIKNYIKTTLPSPIENIPTVDFMEFNFDDENESDNENDVITNNGDSSILDSIITNNGDGSTLDSTDQVDDNVHFNFNFNFVGNERNEGRTDEIERNNANFTFEGDNEFRFQELDEVTAEDTVKEHTTNDDDVKEDILKDDTLKGGAVDKELSLEINLDYIGMDSTSDINVDELVQDLDFVSEDLMKFDDPELDSIFDSDTIEIDNLVDTQNSNVVKNNTLHNEVLVKDTDNPAKEADHVAQAQDLLNPEINGDLNETYLQDYDESSKFLDYEEKPFKSLDFEESSSKLQNFDKDIPQLQDYDESSTNLQNFYNGESKLQEVLSTKLPNHENESTLKNVINDDLHAKEVLSQLQDFEIINNFDKNEKSTSLQDLNGNQVEISSKEITNAQENDLPDYDEDEEIIYLLNYDDDDGQDVVIENGNNDLPDYVEDEEWKLSNENVTNEKEANKENENVKVNILPNGNEKEANKEDEKVKENLLNGNVINEKETNNELPDYEENEEEENNLSNGNVINEEEDNNDLPNYEKESNLPNGNVIIENEINDSLDYNTNDVETNENEERTIRHDENDNLQDYDNDIDENYVGENNVEEMNEDDESNQDNPFIFSAVEEDLDEEEYGNIQDIQDIRRKVTLKNNDPELLKILNIIWKICQENDGLNSEVLLEANVKELAVKIIRSLNKNDTHIECLSIALQILSILTSWHPELTIDLQNDDSWMIINHAKIYIDMFFPRLEDNIELKQLVLPAQAGSAIHIYFHTVLFNSPNPSVFIYNYLPPPQLIPDSNIFNNVYNKSNLKPGEGVIQPFNEDFSGKWCGYFAYFQLPIPRESTMDITSLEFSPSEPGKVYYLNHYIGHEPVRVTDRVVKTFSGRGTDQIGEFVINHGIINEKGNVNFIKSYVGAHSWIYDGVLLPVGICGRWGNPYKWSGNFWIWKR